jgi:hypothetical protein
VLTPNLNNFAIRTQKYIETMSSAKDIFENFKGLYRDLTQYQKVLHSVTGPSDNPNHYDNFIPSPFVHQYRKGAWYHHFSEKMPVTSVNDKSITFTANSRPHGLMHTDFCFQLPHIIFKEGYEGRWTHNIGSNAITTGTCLFNSVEIQTLTHIYFDFHTQTFTSADQHDSFQIDLGNIPSLTSFQKVLPRHTTSYTIPWFFSKNDATFFRLLYCSFLDKLSFNVEYKSALSDLLQIRNIETGELVPPSKFHNKLYVIEGSCPEKDNPFIGKPSMWGKYLYLSDVECNYHSCPPIEEAPRNVFDIDHVIVYESDEKKNLNYKARSDNLPPVLITKDKINSAYPAYIVYAAARNVKAYEQKYYSNYSTNANDHLEGYSPIDDVTLSPKTDLFLVKNIPSWRMERSDARRQFIRAPFEPGYIGWCGGVKANDPLIIPGHIWKEGQVKLNLKDTNPYHLANKLVNHDIDAEYQLIVVLVCSRRLTFTKYSRTEEERALPQSNASITIASE